MHPISTSRKHIPFRIRVDSIGDAVGTVGEELAGSQGFATRGEGVAVDCGWVSEICDVGCATSVCDIECFEVGGEFETVGGYEVVGDRLDYACLWGEAIDLDQSISITCSWVVMSYGGYVLTCGRISGSRPYPCLQHIC